MVQAIIDRTRSVQGDKPQLSRSLRVVPILGTSHDLPTYQLLKKENLDKVIVTEISQNGSVPELMIENKSSCRVYLMDGQELIGAKQNRILNTDVMVPANSSLKIPVSCVEQGRWHHISTQFTPGKSASHRLRCAKLSRVHDSVRQTGKHDANQGAVWNEVQMCLNANMADSDTAALSAAYERRHQELSDFRKSLKMPEQAVGLAVFRGDRLMGLDLFDRHSTLVGFWETLLDSYAIDLLADAVDPATTDAVVEDPTIQAIRQALAAAGESKWEDFPSPGEGRDHRLSNDSYNGAALVWDSQVVIHLQLFPKQQQRQETPDIPLRIRRRYL